MGTAVDATLATELSLLSALMLAHPIVDHWALWQEHQKKRDEERQKYFDHIFSEEGTEEETWPDPILVEDTADPLAFLKKPDALEMLHSIENYLSAQISIVEKSFSRYVVTGDLPAPHYPFRICVILRKSKESDLEMSFLAAWCRHFGWIGRDSGARYADLVSRAKKLGVVVPDSDRALASHPLKRPTP
ncbi:hypothetical protein [Ancylobacter defluvii]|uniref:Uncharacterized protein n=1 Tax=Ancylobacter defluvii TaxID=1282440 RepID=A0A9W6JXP9_9HYPH|nr:hypothetical protein [Ancylobacter defluvii]MBS7586059.1 hypothetical protein [Ancylobacter defluvii]GLK84438.1 hypothetical protein GCM10017653_25080 [Ancylobacter defluvii]